MTQDMWKLLIFITAAIVPTNGRAHSKIYNGADANENEWPFTVWIMRNGVFRCGGVLIDRLWVATAAHCVDRSGTYNVVLGDLDRDSTSGNEQTISVEDKVIHPDYDDIFIDNDIALLYLSERALTSQSNIRKMSRLSNDSIDAQILADSSISCGITGWGYEIDDRGFWRLAPVLQELSVEIIGNGRCNNFLLGNRNPSNICYRAKQREGGTCSGDSGSPLVCRVNRKWTLVGIHSFRMNLDGCRGGVKAATRVSMFASWIESVIG